MNKIESAKELIKKYMEKNSKSFVVVTDKKDEAEKILSDICPIIETVDYSLFDKGVATTPFIKIISCDDFIEGRGLNKNKSTNKALMNRVNVCIKC